MGYVFNPFTGNFDYSGSGETWKVDRTPVETPNGVRVIFTLPSSDTYVTDSLVVYLNGQALTKVADFTETSTTTFTFVVAPQSSDIIRLVYRTA